MLISDVRGRFYGWDIRPERWLEFGCALAGRDLTRAEWRAAFGGRDKQRVCPTGASRSVVSLSARAGS